MVCVRCDGKGSFSVVSPTVVQCPSCKGWWYEHKARADAAEAELSRLRAERDAALARLAAAERERDEARAELAHEREHLAAVMRDANEARAELADEKMKSAQREVLPKPKRKEKKR